MSKPELNLLPCPFCGGIAHYDIVENVSGNDTGCVICHDCRAATAVTTAAPSPDGALLRPMLMEMWNRRIPKSKNDEAVEVLLSAVEKFLDAEARTIFYDCGTYDYDPSDDKYESDDDTPIDGGDCPLTFGHMRALRDAYQATKEQDQSEGEPAHGPRQED